MSARPPAAPAAAPHGGFPGLRWLGALWLAVYLPTYAHAYGPRNFLFLCNVGVILTAVGLIARSRLLVSSQAVAAPVIALAWAIDAGWRVATGGFLYGATAYMWDAAYPLPARLLSLYHLAWPVLLWAVLRRTGYDRRGWALQAAIAAAAMVASRAFAPASENINFAWTDPFRGRQLGPAPLHLLLSWAALAGVGYGATHALLRRGFPDAAPHRAGDAADGGGGDGAGDDAGGRAGAGADDPGMRAPMP